MGVFNTTNNKTKVVSVHTCGSLHPRYKPSRKLESLPKPWTTTFCESETQTLLNV